MSGDTAARVAELNERFGPSLAIVHGADGVWRAFCVPMASETVDFEADTDEDLVAAILKARR